MFIIKNVTKKPIDIGGVSVPPGIPYTVAAVTDPMLEKLKAKALSVTFGDETLEERQADAAAFKPFSTGDKGIDG